MPDGSLLAAVEGAAAAAKPHGAAVVVNNRADVAAVASVGVHLGEEDLPAEDARPLLSPEALLGVSTHDAAAAATAFAAGLTDYVAFGPVFASATKTGRAPRGLEELARVAAGKTRPLVAIGGITAETLDAVLDAGADSAAMVGALMEGGRLEENARRVLDRARRRALSGRIYLVGFMGSGKTTVGQRIADRLDVPFVDLDAEIERTSGLTVRALFEGAGEEEFRRREALFLQATEVLPRAVVATGAGCFARRENQDAMRRLGRTVFLDVPFPVIRRRLAGKTDRPLFQSAEQAERLYAERSAFYKMAPTCVALTGGEEVEGTSDRVLAALFDRSFDTPTIP
jgi:thiamine-phosphate diphosphorylase